MTMRQRELPVMLLKKIQENMPFQAFAQVTQFVAEFCFSAQTLLMIKRHQTE